MDKKEVYGTLAETYVWRDMSVNNRHHRVIASFSVEGVDEAVDVYLFDLTSKYTEKIDVLISYFAPIFNQALRRDNGELLKFELIYDGTKWTIKEPLKKYLEELSISYYLHVREYYKNVSKTKLIENRDTIIDKKQKQFISINKKITDALDGFIEKKQRESKGYLDF